MSLFPRTRRLSVFAPVLAVVPGLVLCVVVTLVVVISVDAILTRRSRRRSSAPDEPDELEPADDEGDAGDDWQPETDGAPAAWSDAPHEQTTSVVRPRRNP